MTDKELFMNFKEFWSEVGKKRSHSGALEDINWIKFDNIKYDKDTKEYIANIRMKEKYKKGYMINPFLVENDLIFMENIHMIHWAEWLNIAIMNKLYPELQKKFNFVTRVEIVLNEPTFIEQPMVYRMKILKNRPRMKKHEFTFINRIGYWLYLIIDYTIVEDQFPILKHYFEKHESI